MNPRLLVLLPLPFNIDFLMMNAALNRLLYDESGAEIKYLCRESFRGL